MSKKYDELSESELVLKLNELDHAAFKVTYERFRPLLFKFVLTFTKDEEQARDVVQDVFTKLFLKMGTLNTEIPLGSFLYRMLRNRILDIIRHEKIKTKYLNSLVAYAQEGDYTTDSWLIEKETQELIEKEVARLPPKMRAVFELSRKAYMSHTEIAEAAGIERGTVKKQISYAIKTLRSKLSAFFYLYLMSCILVLREILS